MSKTRHVGADVSANRLRCFRPECSAPSATTLNVLRVALERADMPRRATGFMDHEIAAAVEWVRAAIAAQAAAKGEHHAAD